MKDLITKEDLKAHGFTESQVSILQKLAEKDNKSFTSLLEELKKRFYAGIFLFSLMTVVLIISGINYEKGHFTGIAIASIFLYASVIFLIPMRLGYKAMKFMRSRKKSF